jgi:hypothetical protein
MAVRRRPRYSHLTDRELAGLIGEHDERAREELIRRYQYLCAAEARDLCVSLHHRGHLNACQGDRCDGAYGAAFVELVDRLAGHAADPARRRSARKGVFQTYYEGPQHNTPDSTGGITLEAFFRNGLRSGGLTDARRAYLADRGLHVRIRERKTDLTHAALIGAWTEWVLEDSAAGRAAADLELRAEDMPALLEAMWIDATETPPADDVIDLRRIALLVGRAGGNPDQLRRVVDALEALVAFLAPNYYDDYLGRPRDHARTPLAVDEPCPPVA